MRWNDTLNIQDSVNVHANNKEMSVRDSLARDITFNKKCTSELTNSMNSIERFRIVKSYCLPQLYYYYYYYYMREDDGEFLERGTNKLRQQEHQGTFDRHFRLIRSIWSYH